MVDSLHTNTREICEQVRDWNNVLVCGMHVSYICTKILQQVRKEHSLPPLPPQVVQLC